jgi:hypothetical protein
MDKKSIIANIESLTAEQLFDEIIKGIVTLDELKATGNLDSSIRKAISKLIAQRDKEIADSQAQLDKEDDEAWERVKYGNESDIRGYIAGFPNGKHISEARREIDRITEQWEREQADKRKILDNLRRNPNSYTPGEIQGYLQNGTIRNYDLLECGIPENIIGRLENIVTPSLHPGETPDSIPEGYTEVYFWGIPGSGKTCALAATLSVAEKLGYLDISVGPGYNYMTLLKNIFIEDNAILPAASPVDATQYLPFVIRKGKDKPRSISLIELSGEIFQCFFRKNANLPLQSQQHNDTFESLIRFLKGKNRKIHFFFIDFERENNPDMDGYTQGDYLSAASTFFKNNDILGKSTDAIYIVITKSDLMPDAQTYSERVKYSIQHLQTHNFSAFINTLKGRCKQHSINAGKLTVEPFSLGKVYFQSICDFEKSSAERILDILIERIRPTRKSILDEFNK